MKKHFLIVIIFILLAVLVHAQKTTSLSDFQFNKLIENIVLNTDKDLYLSGEQIWFSGFYIQDGQLSDKELSKVLYVELFNAKKDIIWQGKFGIEKTVAAGKIDIPSEIFSGTYFLRAYTQLQKNNPPESYFTKAISIINPSVPLPLPNQLLNEEIVISPAGGELFFNVENFIALRMQNGLTELLTSIWISDQYGNQVATPVINKNGLGYVYLLPVDTLHYTLKMAFIDGDTVAKKLPVSSHSGLVMSTKIEGKFLKIKINKNNLTENSKNNFHLKIFSASKQEMVDTVFTGNGISLKASLFESKIYLCELTNPNNQILARHYFIGQIKTPKPVLVQTDKKVYALREKVELTIENGLQNETSIISISVTAHGTNDLSSILLPNYLVDNPMLIPFFISTSCPIDSTAQKQLEIALQLNSFPFKNIFSEKSDSFLWPPETSDINIAALLRYKKSKEPVVGRTVYVSVLGEEPQLHANKTQPDGMVYFSLNHSTDTKDVFLSAESTNDEEIELLVLNDFSGEFSDLVDVPINIDTSYRKQLEENWKSLQVENQYLVLEKLKTEEELPMPSRFGTSDYHIETKDFIELSSVEEMFKELIPYTRLKKKAGEYYFEVMDPGKNAVYDNPLILLDDVPIFNYSGLANLPFSIIESVDVYNKQYLYGDFVFNGIVLIRTKTDNFAGLMMPYGSVFAVYQTITPEVIIQFPDYSTENKKQSRLPEFRTMLFWEPDITLTSIKSSFTFFTSDYSADYDVIIQGITKDGEPCFGTTSFRVNSEKSK